MSSSRDPEAKNPRLFDVRTVERNIKRGLISRKDYEKHLKSLADATEKASAPDGAARDDDEGVDDDADDEDEDDDPPAGS